MICETMIDTEHDEKYVDEKLCGVNKHDFRRVGTISGSNA